MIKTYSKARDGNNKLSDSFRVREFACKDGSDKIIIDDALVSYLQRIRNWAGAEIIISSGYRTPAHNASIGGAKTSYHTKGRAADIYVKDRKKTIGQIADYAQAIGVKGIEKNEDSNYVHIDTRPNKYYWIRRGKKDITVTYFCSPCTWKEPTKSLKYLSRGDGVKWLQWWLRVWGYDRGLKVDGIAGEKTRAALKGY